MKPSGQWNGNYWQADYDLGDHDCLRNVWLGISAEDQRRFDERAADLLVIPAAVRWISFEPLLGQIDAWELLKTGAFGWAVVGGESGPNARPMHKDWARFLRDQSIAAGIPFHFKQHGSWLEVYDRELEDPDWKRTSEVVRLHPRGRWLNLAGSWIPRRARRLHEPVHKTGVRPQPRWVDSRRLSGRRSGPRIMTGTPRLTIKVEGFAGCDLKEAMVDMIRVAQVTGCRAELRANETVFWVVPSDTEEEIRAAFDRLYPLSAYVATHIQLPVRRFRKNPEA